jgi:class 3 adenylate cyclase
MSAAVERRLAAYRAEVANLVGEHRGRVVDFTGDNFLSEFRTATDAVGAAAEIQRVIRARNATLPAGRAMEFRIGVHLGEVRAEGERLCIEALRVVARTSAFARGQMRKAAELTPGRADLLIGASHSRRAATRQGLDSTIRKDEDLRFCSTGSTRRRRGLRGAVALVVGDDGLGDVARL